MENVDEETIGPLVVEPSSSAASSSGLPPVGWSSVLVPGAKKIKLNPDTSIDYKLMMPDACAPNLIGIRFDSIRGLYAVRYDHTTPEARALWNPDKVASLPQRLQTKSKQNCHGPDASHDEEQASLEACLQWAWDKHTHLWGAQRPESSIVVHGGSA